VYVCFSLLCIVNNLFFASAPSDDKKRVKCKTQQRELVLGMVRMKNVCSPLLMTVCILRYAGEFVARSPVEAPAQKDCVGGLAIFNCTAFRLKKL